MGICINYSALETSERRIDEMCNFIVSKAKEAGYQYKIVDTEGGYSYGVHIDFYSKKRYKSITSYLRKTFFRVIELPSYRALDEVLKRPLPFVSAFVARFTEEENRAERLRRLCDPFIVKWIASNPRRISAEKRRRFFAWAYPFVPLTLKGDFPTRIKGVIVRNGVCESFKFLFAKIGNEWLLDDSTKTQPFKYGEEKECAKFHIFICECLRKLKKIGGLKWRIHDEGQFYQTRNIEVLMKNYGVLGMLIYGVASELKKAAQEAFGDIPIDIKIGDHDFSQAPIT